MLFEHHRRDIRNTEPLDRVQCCPYFEQERVNWCWAACVAMVASGYGFLSVQQCSMADWLFGRPTDYCCVDKRCDRGCEEEDIARVFAEWRFQIEPRVGSLTEPELQTALERGPVAVGFRREHLVLVIAKARKKRYLVHDPAVKGPSTSVPYDSLITGYGGGKWVRTWLNVTPRES